MFDFYCGCGGVLQGDDPEASRPPVAEGSCCTPTGARTCRTCVTALAEAASQQASAATRRRQAVDQPGGTPA